MRAARATSSSARGQRRRRLHLVVLLALSLCFSQPLGYLAGPLQWFRRLRGAPKAPRVDAVAAPQVETPQRLEMPPQLEMEPEVEMPEQFGLPAREEDEKHGGSGRRVVAQHEDRVSVRIEGASASDMDKFMEDKAREVCLSGFSKSEPTGEDLTESYVYMEPRNAGPYTIHIRLTARVFVSPGKADIQTSDLKLWFTDRFTGRDIDGQMQIDLQSENAIMWQDDGEDGVEVVNSAMTRMDTRLPWWHPLPDSVMQRILSIAVKQVVASGQKEATAKLQELFQDWAKK